MANVAALHTPQKSFDLGNACFTTARNSRVSTGLFNLLGASSKFVVSSMAVLALITTDSWVPVYYILAAVGNGVLSKLVKQTLKQPRPVESGEDGYGMPSSHAQSFFFFLAVLAINRARVFGNDRAAVVVCAVLALYSSAASYWRVATNLHTIAQTLAGAVLGISVALAAARTELIGVACLRRVVALLFGVQADEADEVVWAPKACITVAAAAVVCKREIKALVRLLGQRNKGKFH